MTISLRERINHHQDGLTKSTKPYLPLYLDSYIALTSRDKASNLERYLKSGSGKAILRKRILTDEASA